MTKSDQKILADAEMWIGRLIANGGHLECVMPNHAVRTLQRLNDLKTRMEEST